MSGRTSLLVLALAAFAAVTTEMLPIGLLPQIGTALGVAESTVGLVVSLYAVMVAVLAVPLTVATRRVRPKRLLVAALGCYALSSVVVALAPSFAALAAGRAIGGATHALFFSVCTGYAARLVPRDQTGRAIALSQAGASAGFVLGVPLATALGSTAGWRTAFAALAVLALVVLALVVRVLPDVVPAAGTRRPEPGRWRRMVPIVGPNTLAYLGHYTLYTYVTVLLVGSGAPGRAVAPILLGFGLCGLVGLWSAARAVDSHPWRSAWLILGALGVGIAAVAAGVPALAVVLPAGAVWSAAFAPVATLFGAAAVRADATSPELAGAWINATCNVGIGAGAAVGGGVLAAAGIRDVAWLAAALVALAAVVVVVARRAFQLTPPSQRREEARA